MKKCLFLCLIFLLLLAIYSYATVPDDDLDGVPDTNDQCTDSLTDVVDQFGCSCAQKNCVSDDNQCTDDCGVVNGLVACNAPNSNQCEGGYCYGGRCVNGSADNGEIKKKPSDEEVKKQKDYMQNKTKRSLNMPLSTLTKRGKITDTYAMLTSGELPDEIAFSKGEDTDNTLYILEDPNGNLIQKTNFEINSQTFLEDSYIVEFKEPSAFEFRAQQLKLIENLKEEVQQLDQKIQANPLNVIARIDRLFTKYYLNSKISNLNDSVKEQITKIEELIKQAKDDIASSNKITAQAIGQSTANMGEEFSIVFSGFSIEAPQEIIEKIRNLNYVKEVHKNGIVFTTLKESVPLISAPDVWKLDKDGNDCLTTGKECLTGKGIKIAIIDTGVDYTHPDLGGCLGATCKVIGGYDIVNNDNDPMDDYGHGTHVAATAAGKDPNGIYNGVAPDAKILAYKVLSSFGSGTFDEVIAGIERAVDPNQDGDFSDKADVISISLGGYGDPDDPMSKAVDNVVDNGVVAVIAAGNSGSSSQTILSPGTSRKAITVGAIYKNGYIIASFSSRGPVVWNNQAIIKPDIVAPGVNICAAQWDSWLEAVRECSPESYGRISISGTSMATPHVAGTVALIKQAHPDWNPQEIKTVLKNTASRLFNEVITSQGFGRINALKSIQSPKLPVAHLQPLQFIVKGGIDILGTATADNFKEYSLFYERLDEGMPLFLQNFKLISTSNSPVSDDSLLKGFNTADLEDGYTFIKLLVTGQNGNSAEDYAVININNMEITSVGDTLNYFKKGKVKIYGSIFTEGISAYKIEKKYEKEQKEQIAPVKSSWEEVCNKQSMPSDKVLCEIDTSSFENGLYEFKLSVFRNNAWISDVPFKAALVQELMDNWPLEFNGWPRGHPLILNINNNQGTKLIVPHYNSCQMSGIFIQCNGTNLLLFESNGQYQKIEYLDDGSAVGYDKLPSIYFDMDQNQDLIVTNAQQKEVIIFDLNGKVKYSLGHDIIQPDFNFIGPYILFDRSQDGIPELYSIYLNFVNGDTLIYGFNKDGYVQSNFPIAVQKENGLDGTIVLRHVTFLKQGNNFNIGLMAANFLSTDYSKIKLYADVYTEDAKSKTWTKKRIYLFDDLQKSVAMRFSFPASADLDNDGNYEWILGYSIIDLDLFYKNPYDIDAYRTYIVIIDSNGNLVAKSQEIKGYTILDLAVGNLGYGNPTIVAAMEDTWSTYLITGQKIMAFDEQANILFDKNLYDFNDLIQGITIGDVDNDAQSDIVINYRNRWYNGRPSGIQIFDSNGILKREIEIPTLGQVDDYWGSRPIITDFNGDSKADIILQSLHWSTNYNNLSTRLYPIELNQPYDISEIDWPTLLHDNQHTSIFNSIDRRPQIDRTPPTVTLEETTDSATGRRNILVICTDTESQCDSTTYKFQIIEDINIGTECPKDLSNYISGGVIKAGPVTKNTPYSWICAYSKDFAGNEAFSQPAPFRILLI